MKCSTFHVLQCVLSWFSTSINTHKSTVFKIQLLIVENSEILYALYLSIIDIRKIRRKCHDQIDVLVIVNIWHFKVWKMKNWIFTGNPQILFKKLLWLKISLYLEDLKIVCKANNLRKCWNLCVISEKVFQTKPIVLQVAS